MFTATFGSVTEHRVVFEKRDGLIYKVKIVATVSKVIPLDKIVAAWQSSGASFWINPGKDPKNPGQDMVDEFAELMNNGE